MTNSLSQLWDIPSSSWNDRTQTIYTNNPSGTVNQAIFQTWNIALSTWENTQRTTYKNFGSVETIPVLVLPEIVKNSKGQLSTGEILENKLRYYRYTSTGKVLEAQKENGSIICYIYDHDKKNIISMIENATFSQIASQLGLTINELENIAPIGYSPLAAIEGLRTTLTNAMVTTYTYNSNDQITSITDPKGDKVNYQYDIFQRLIRIIDKNGSTLSENEYHYKP